MTTTTRFPTRRNILAGFAATAGATALKGIAPSIAEARGANTLHAITTGAANLLGAGKPETGVWAYRGQVPGPLLRVRQGETLRARLINQLEQPTTVHWHGIRISNAMDGVPELTQPAVAADGTFDYAFNCPDAGTYWYHPHKLASEQIARGLYGVLIVDEKEPPQVDQDLVLVFDDWRLQDDGQIHAESFGSIGERAHGGRYGNVYTVNGSSDYKIAAQASDRLRLRLCNVSNANVFAVQVADHKMQVIALDGQPVEPFEAESDRVVLASGQRADVIVDLTEAPGTASPINVYARQQQFTVGTLRYDASMRKRSQPMRTAVRLPPNPLNTSIDLDNAHPVTLTMEGGAMGRMEGAHIGGKWFGMRDLVRERGFVWALEGHAGMPAKPLFSVKQGRTVVIKMINRTRWPHAMHIHGHHFRAIKSSLEENPKPWWRDTHLMFAHEEAYLAFVADNPGKWMLHCHMLEHHEGGMGTWFEVTT